MAATWEYTLVIKDLSAKIIDVSAVRTDGEDVRTFALPGILADTHEKPLAEIRDEVAAAMYAKYLTQVAKEAAATTLINGWELSLKSATEALEP